MKCSQQSRDLGTTWHSFKLNLKSGENLNYRKKKMNTHFIFVLNQLFSGTSKAYSYPIGKSTS